MVEGLKNRFLRTYFSDDTRCKVYKKISTQLKYNIQDWQAISIQQKRYADRRHPLQYIFADILTNLENGQTLDLAFFKWIPQEEAMLLRGGQQGANIHGALLDCATLIQAKSKIKNSLIGALAYPILLFFLFIILIFVISFYLIPELSLVSSPEKWTGLASSLYSFSIFFTSNLGVALFCVSFGVILLAVFSLPYHTGKLRIKLDLIPPWSIYRLLTGSVWLFTVAILIRANLQMDQILEDMINSGVLKPWLYERVKCIKDLYEDKAHFGTILVNLNMNFPDAEIAEDLAIYATLPGFDKNLYAIAKDWLEEGTQRIQNQAQILNIALILGIVVILCLLGLAIGSMQEQISSSMGGF